MNSTVRRVAVLGGSRIPFARQNGPYAKASNQDMLTTALNAVVEKFVLEGERLDEVAAHDHDARLMTRHSSSMRSFRSWCDARAIPRTPIDSMVSDAHATPHTIASCSPAR